MRYFDFRSISIWPCCPVGSSDALAAIRRVPFSDLMPAVTFDSPVALGVPPDVQGGRLAARKGLIHRIDGRKSTQIPPGETPRLYGRRDVRHYAKHWLILRLAGMIGLGLRKNPVFDILHNQPLRIHPDSQFQYMNTDDVARLGWELFESGAASEIFNICGDGVIAMREIARLAGRELNRSALKADATPRIVEASNDKLKRRTTVPLSQATVERFVRGWPANR